MRTTVVGDFGPEFLKIFTRRPEISLTLMDGQVVSGNAWMIFANHLTLGGIEVAYDSIISYFAEVDLGSPFGQYLTEPSDDKAWSFWSQCHDIGWFVKHLRDDNEIKFSMLDPTTDTFVEGKLHSVSATDITLANGAIRVDRTRILWVCHRL